MTIKIQLDTGNSSQASTPSQLPIQVVMKEKRLLSQDMNS